MKAPKRRVGVDNYWLFGELMVEVAFFLACEELGRMFDHSFPACACFFIFKVEINSGTLIPLFCQNQSTVAQRAETTVAECSLSSCV